MLKLTKNKSYFLIYSLILLFILILHLVKLTALPVFADESIYIRWAQLIIDDTKQYLFFPLNDGKTPIFIWLLVPFQFIFSDQLFAGRFLAILTGIFQIIIIGKIIKELEFEKMFQYIGMLLTGLLPYWFFHHHLALMDGLLTLFLSLATWQTLKLIKKPNSKKTIFFIGLSFGLAMLTKIPALLFIPSLLIISFFLPQENKIYRFKSLISASIAIVIGLLFFLLLKLHPAFGQLFSRGGDFLFSWQEILLNQKWRETLPNSVTYLSYFKQYFTWPLILISIIGLLFNQKKKVLIFHLCWISLALPIFLMGKVVYPRYLFPVSLTFTLAVIASIKSLLSQKLWLRTITWILLAITFTQSALFIHPLLFDVEKIPFVSADQGQYLTEWSAGFGIKETVEILQEKSQTHTVLALSEGYFGTLPDGLLMYLHREKLDNLFVIGIGQPVTRLKPEVIELAQQYDQTLLIANSHRLLLDLSNAKLILQVCRPYNAPCHQVWDITTLIP